MRIVDWGKGKDEGLVWEWRFKNYEGIWMNLTNVDLEHRIKNID
jgi:hypothetical protein